MSRLSQTKSSSDPNRFSKRANGVHIGCRAGSFKDQIKSISYLTYEFILFFIAFKYHFDYYIKKRDLIVTKFRKY